MRCLRRNKQKFYYALYEDRKEVTDEYGNATGQFEIIRGNPNEFWANISAAKGETQTRQFGESETYDKVIVMGNDAPDIDEYSVLWIDTVPQLDDNGEVITPYDYVVKKVAKSINSISLAVSKVSVSASE